MLCKIPRPSWPGDKFSNFQECIVGAWHHAGSTQLCERSSNTPLLGVVGERQGEFRITFFKMGSLILESPPSEGGGVIITNNGGKGLNKQLIKQEFAPIFN